MSKAPSTQQRICFVSSEADRLNIQELPRKEVCKDLEPKYEYEGNFYCVLHYPDDNKHINTDFNEIFRQRLEKQENSFRSVYFSDRLDISEHVFQTRAMFENCVFKQGLIANKTTFLDEAHFCWTVFGSSANFDATTFNSGAFFDTATFIASVNFKDVNFKDRVWLGKFSTKGYRETVVFQGGLSFLEMQNARIESPEKFLIYSVNLRPSWLAYVDSRKFHFHNINWGRNFGKHSYIRAEIKNLGELGIADAESFLRITCRYLAENAEENRRFEEASKFRLMAEELTRLKTYKGFTPWTLHWWYWFSSFYGESWRRAATVLIILVFMIFPLIYTTRVFQVCPLDKPVTMSLTENKCTYKNLEIFDGGAILQSLATATFQTTEYRRPASGWGEFWIIIEKIFVPIQAALLLLAIRRKFMR